MTERIRTKETYIPTGLLFNDNTDTWSDPNAMEVGTSETCVDNILPGDCHEFSVSRLTNVPARVNRPFLRWTVPAAQDYACDSWRNRTNSYWEVGIIDVPVPSDGEVATMAAARTNPSAPIVDVIANVLELGDIALLLKRTIGDGVLKAIARNNLRFQFGIKPLIGDLVKLADFAEHVERRVKVIEKLAGPRGYRRTIRIGKYSGFRRYPNYDFTINSHVMLIQSPLTRRHDLDIRAHVRWKAAHWPESLQSPSEMRALAKRAILGLGSPVSVNSLASAWEAMPWSWLIDWCSNVGQYFTVYRNIIPAELLHVSVIKRSTYTCTTDAQNRSYQGNPWTVSAGSRVRESLTRSRAYPTLSAHWPFLSANQMGILASLAITKWR